MAKYKITIECEDSEEFKELARHSDYQSLAFELEHNFHRQFRHSEESEEFNKGVEHVLEKLQDIIYQHLHEN